jgi:hypothetical protein
VSDFHFFDQSDDVDLILSGLNNIVSFIAREPLGEDIMPGNLDFMKVLVGGNDIILGQEEFLGVFNFLKSSIEIAARYPKEEENKKDGTSDHAEKEVEFLVVPKRMEVLICDPVEIVKSKGCNLKLGSIRSSGSS